MAIQHGPQTASDIIETARALAPLIQKSVVEMEMERCLPPQVVDALREFGAFRLAVPSVYGGLELDLMTQVRMRYQPAGRLLLGLESGDPLF